MRTFTFQFLSFLLATLSSINAIAQCTANFDTTIAGTTVNFTDQSTGTYNWVYYDFGDGNFAQNVSNPTHTYDTGLYQCCLYIQDTVNFTCFDDTCVTISIGGVTCDADFFPFANGLTVEFYSFSIGVYDSLWYDFGDGNGSNDTLPLHTYASAGTYSVCLSLFNGGTICDSTCYTIVLDSNGCEADFSYTADNLEVTFTDESIGDYNQLFWDFGDGFGSSQQANPTYTYFTAGTYEVCLTIFDSLGGCFDEYCEFITVTSGGGGGSNCTAKYTYEAEELEVVFTNTSPNAVTITSWDFGDGSAPNFDLSPEHIFDDPGTYEVCLTNLNLFPFCTDTYCEEITVYDFTCEPSFDYSFNELNGFTFINTTTVGNVTSVEWEFGDGNTSTFSQPVYYYNTPGTYEVCLRTFDGVNLCGETCKEVIVFPLGVEESSTTDFIVFPNPSDGLVHLNIPAQYEGKQLQVMITDSRGRLMKTATTGGASNVTLSTSVAGGTYHLTLLQEGAALFSTRLIIR